jgi:hypothetical protein
MRRLPPTIDASGICVTGVYQGAIVAADDAGVFTEKSRSVVHRVAPCSMAIRLFRGRP